MMRWLPGLILTLTVSAWVLYALNDVLFREMAGFCSNVPVCSTKWTCIMLQEWRIYSVSQKGKWLIFNRVVVVVVILFKRKRVVCSMFHSFGKYIHGLWKKKLLTNLRHAMNGVQLYPYPISEIVEHWNKPCFRFIYQWLACSTVLEHVWNRCGTVWQCQSAT